MKQEATDWEEERTGEQIARGTRRRAATATEQGGMKNTNARAATLLAAPGEAPQLIIQDLILIPSAKLHN